MTLWLVGMMGSGKTSAGRLAAETLRVLFHDTDELIVSEAGMTIPRIWQQEGESGFRMRERAAVRGVAGEEAVVATGGGAVLTEENRETMRSTGVVVWLSVSVDTLAGRVGDDGERPLLGSTDVFQALRRLSAQRWRLYETVAHHRIDSDELGPEEVAERIRELWPG